MIRKVLFVDDDQIMLLALKKRLAKYNDTFSMILAEDGFDAVRKLKENTVSMVVLDLKMPRMDGVSLLNHISDKYPDIPVVIISGYRTEEMHNLAKEKEVVAYISKPFQVDDLAKVILATLRKEAEGGTLHNVSPVVFLQLMEMESRTCTIRIINRTSDKGGVLFFNNGKLFDARVEQVKGIEAAYIIFTWEDVTLFIRNECPVTVNAINSSLQPIIMKAVGMKDEQMSGTIDEDELDEQSFIFENEPIEDVSEPIDDMPLEEENDSLEDLELPPEVVASRPDPAEVVPSAQEPTEAADSEQDEKLIIDEVRNLLLTQIGDKCGLQDIYHDSHADPILESISKLGDMFNFGRFKMGYVDRGLSADEIYLPGEPAIVIKVRPKCPQDKIVNILTTRL
jgi:CheY-like chemotaxis protein